jgi:hypothetical protein
LVFFYWANDLFNWFSFSIDISVQIHCELVAIYLKYSC